MQLKGMQLSKCLQYRYVAGLESYEFMYGRLPYPNQEVEMKDFVNAAVTRIQIIFRGHLQRR